MILNVCLFLWFRSLVYDHQVSVVLGSKALYTLGKHFTTKLYSQLWHDIWVWSQNSHKNNQAWLEMLASKLHAVRPCLKKKKVFKYMDLKNTWGCPLASICMHIHTNLPLKRWECDSLVKCLPSICGTLGLITSTVKNKTNSTKLHCLSQA